MRIFLQSPLPKLEQRLTACGLAWQYQENLPDFSASQGLIISLEARDKWLVWKDGKKLFVLDWRDYIEKELKAKEHPLLKLFPKNAKILDMTCGWGKDALILAKNGRKLICIEQNPLVYALVSSQLDSYPEGIISIFLGKSEEVLEGQLINADYDAIFIDPMFQEKTSKSLSSKWVQALGLFPSTNSEIPQLENIALAKSCKKIVVKRHRKGEAQIFRCKKPTAKLEGQTCVYDIYAL